MQPASAEDDVVCNFVLLKDAFARTFSAVALTAETLQQYDELDRARASPG